MSVQCITAAATSASAFAIDDPGDVLCGYNSHHTFMLDKMYATMPVVAIQPVSAYGVSAPPDVEELYTSFEQAISDRVMAINGKLRHMASNSHPATPACATKGDIQARVGMVKPLLHITRRCLLFGCLALMLLLIGFDLMGLLMLSMH